MRLKEFRLDKGMTQEEVAKRLGIPKKTYQNYEREVREADSDVLCALADLYETSLDELVGRSGVSSGKARELWMQEDIADLTNCYVDMSEKAREILLTLANELVEQFPREER